MLSLTKGGITMATIKSFTSLEQSKKLAEILPLESADMSWVSCDDGRQKFYQAENRKRILDYEKNHWLPCWSLAALLGVLPNGIVMNKDSQNGRYHFSSTHAGTYVTTDNPVDACVAMIEKLNELNLL